MPTYIVTRKSDGSEVYRYDADTPIEWDGMAFADHHHTEAQPADLSAAPEAFRPEDWFINIGPFFDRFGAYKLPILASTDPLVQAVIKDATVRKYIDLKGRRAELVQAIGLLQGKGFPLNAAAVLDVQPSSEEVYRG